MVDNPVLNDRYHLIEQIGSGGMAVLYKAKDMELGRIVAIKVLRPSLVSDPEFLSRFKREARSAANLSHPNIVTVYDVGQAGPSTPFIIMEYVEGQNLKQIIRASSQPFELDDVLAITIEVCKGVGYAHRAGLVHCDVKPQNILITPEKNVKVVDFGIARAFTGEAVEEYEEVVWGSPHYFSPEVAAGSAPTPASDVYSIGIVMFEMLTGQLPFTGSEYQELALAHIQREPPNVMTLNPAVPHEVARIVNKTLTKEPSARYRTADQLGRILQSYRNQYNQRTSSFAPLAQRDFTSDSPDGPEPEALESISGGLDAGQQQTMASPQRRGQPIGQRSGPNPADQGQVTMPSLPPLDIDRIIGRPPAQQPPYAGQGQAPATSRARQTEQPRGYRQPAGPQRAAASAAGAEEDEELDLIPGVDVYGIVLGIFAAAAVLGLIPLWITVFIVLTRP